MFDVPQRVTELVSTGHHSYDWEALKKVHHVGFIDVMHFYFVQIRFSLQNDSMEFKVFIKNNRSSTAMAS